MAIIVPTDINDCVLWLDGSDASTVTLEELDPDESNIISGWGVDHASEASVVNQWRDKSSNQISIDMFSSRRPSFVENSIGGLSSLKFDGNDYFDIPDDLFNYENMTIVMLGMCYNIARSRSVIVTNRRSADTELLRLTVSEGSGGLKMFRLEAGLLGGEDFIDSSFPAAENIPFIYSLQSLKGFLEGRINTHSAGVARIASQGSLKDVRIAAGKGGSQAEGVMAYFGEVIIYNRAINNSEREDLENYLISKWSIDVQGQQ